MKRIPGTGLRPLAILFCVGVLVWAGVRHAGYDLDGDGWLDSIRLGTLDLHLFSTEGGHETRQPPARPAPPGRLYNAPADYVHVLVQKAFQWDGRWEVVRWDGPSRVAELSRRADLARVSLRVEKWRGWALVRVSIQGRGAETAAEEQLIGEAFECLESLLFQGIPKPRTVRGFSPAR